MKKDGIHILGYIEQKFSEPKPVSYTNGNGFELRFSEENEIRMGLWASNLAIYKNKEDLSNQLLSRNFLTSLPNKYQAFSASGRYCLIPTCPILNNPSLIVLDTENLTKKELNIVGILKGNQFAPERDVVLISAYTKTFIYKCDKNVMFDIEIPFENDEIEYAHWVDSTNIRLMVSSKKDSIQRIIDYSIDSKKYEAFEIISPSEVFGFEPLKEITKSDNFCLFNVKGYSSAVVGRLLNQWTFIDFDNKSNVYKFRTNVPISGIYYSKNWKTKGIKTIQQDVEFNFNRKGITGTENAATNIGYSSIADEVEGKIPKTQEGIWSKIKSLWA